MILTDFTLFYMWKYWTICRLCMFFNSDKQLSLRFSNILGIQVTWRLKLINDAISVKFNDLIFQWEIVSNFRCSKSYFNINTNCLVFVIFLLIFLKPFLYIFSNEKRANKFNQKLNNLHQDLIFTMVSSTSNNLPSLSWH